ncbi:asparagine synthase (glutamine-hydrolyzing) [uncultured Clostridium sp.]|uniref:asparagine synthase (glutamine-hydrolyzing) n=1 Tax=uncultured Clostridium sp. TaxID=59620 RepID=UPI0026711DB7|nr:asparagine synthase (glutamine-hydrolyzing) [uncultured Clostridium sp.]
MCGIAGWVNFSESLKSNSKIIKKMTDILERRGPDSEGIYESENVLLGHRRLIVVDPEGGEQPMIKIINGNKYVLVYNGELYNTEELRKSLLEEGYFFDSYSDTEVLLMSYIAWGVNCIKKFNGIFAFAIYDEEKEQVFLVRDQMGVKPLFYSINNKNIIFASEIKAILANPMVKAQIDREGITELFALGPAVIPGKAIYKNILEIAPANCLLISKENIKVWEYWKVTLQENKETVEEAAEHVRLLFFDAIKRQLVGDVPICTFLSGGLDSSAISAIAAEEFRNRGKILNTYSIDYKDNEKYFKSSLFQPTSDKYWAFRMAEFIKSNHKNVVLNHKDLVLALKESTLARDLPGMADVDSSLLLFCKEIRKNFVVSLSGECADEIFGGYPWYTNEEMLNAKTFPWSRAVGMRKSILNEKIKKFNIEECAEYEYLKTLKEVPHFENEDKKNYRMKEMFYLNLKWFMVNLLNRKDRCSMYNSLEVRVPFADIRIVEYAFNLPAEIKLLHGREKGILRKALEGVLPEDVVYRKKSPYPKTHNPIYTEMVCKEMNKILSDNNSPILEIIDKKVVKEIVDTEGKSYTTPWFGQLMTGPQLIAYLIQLNIWMKEYNVNILI